MSIHPTPIVAPGAQVPSSCTVGPYCTIGPDVVLGEDCELVSHVVLDGHTTFGRGNKVFSFACLGIAPQDLKYAGEPTRLTFGDNNSIREYVTISRGTAGGGGVTTVGSDCLIMAYTHIGHDSHIGNGCILANAATLAGHVTVEDYATVGALNPVHQFCTIASTPTSEAAPPSRRTFCPTRSPASNATTMPTASTKLASNAKASHRMS